jgi:hypothetical protein
MLPVRSNLLAAGLLALGQIAAVLLTVPPAYARDRLDLTYSSIQLPGPPASLLAADVSGDGIQDLIVVVAYIYWDQIGIEETVEIDEVEGVVEAMTIVPALFDRRELFVFPGLMEGGYGPALEALELDRSILSLEQGPGELAVLALTDQGVSQLVLEPGADAGAEQGGVAGDFPVPRFEPFLKQESLLSFTGVLLPTLNLIQDYDGDGSEDLLVPVGDHFVLYDAPTLLAARQQARATGVAVSVPPTRSLTLMEEEKEGLVRDIALPLLRDLDGDGRSELLVRDSSASWSEVEVLRNLGPQGYAPPLKPLADWRVGAADDDDWSVIHLGDIDGDGQAEVVTQMNLSDDDAGMRKSMKEAKVPPMKHEVFSLDDQLRPLGEARLSFETIGYAAASDSQDADDFVVPGGFQDLDGDGRLDLVTVTLDFSLLQAVRILATHSLSLGMDFHVYCQNDAGEFRAVSGLDLSGKFKLRLDDLRIGQLSQFAGDFDGDGRRDFVQMGRGRNVTIHRGREGCRYPAVPDLTLKLEQEPRNLALVRIQDFDGDNLSDLLVIQPQKAKEAGLTPPVRLDLYHSRTSTGAAAAGSGQ